MLETTTSADGTTIAFERYGEGEPVVLVSGATSHRAVITNLDSLAAAMTRAATTSWDRAKIRRHAEQFSRSRFVNEIQHVVDDTLKAPAGSRW